jgi:hypothetical protein
MRIRLFILLFSLTILINKNSHAQDINWVKNNTWYFDNFVKDILPWSIFRETFIGVAPSPAGDFDQIFYDAIYKDQLAAEGHCYGIDVMAMMMLKNGGFLGYCHPPYVYSGTFVSNTNPDGMPSNDTVGPDDRALRTAIEIAHGYQISHAFLSFLLDVIALKKNRDGSYAYQQVNFYIAKTDPPVISVTKGLSPADGGHVIIPYFTKDMGGGNKRIYVYDPNRSYYEPGADGRDWYENGNNFISVSGTNWSFTMAGGEVWSGSPGSGGNCLVIPVSIAGRKDRLPQSLLAEGAYALNTITIFGNVKVEQISNLTNDKRFFNGEGTDTELSAEKQLNNILPFIPLNGGKSLGTGGTKVYFFRGADPVKIRYKAYGDYKIGMIYHGKYYEVKGWGKGDTNYFLPEEKNINTSYKQPTN